MLIYNLCTSYTFLGYYTSTLERIWLVHIYCNIILGHVCEPLFFYHPLLTVGMVCKRNFQSRIRTLILLFSTAYFVG